MGILVSLKNKIGARKVRATLKKEIDSGVIPLSKVHRTPKYFNMSYDGASGIGYLMCPAINLERDLPYMSIKIKATNNITGKVENIERITVITQKEIYESFGMECAKIDFKRVDAVIN